MLIPKILPGNQAKSLGRCGLLRERKNQKVSRGFLLIAWGFLSVPSFGGESSRPGSLHYFLFPVPCLPHVSFLPISLSLDSLISDFPVVPYAAHHSFSFYNSFLSLVHLLQSSYWDEHLHPPLWVCLCLWPFPYLWIYIFYLWICIFYNYRIMTVLRTHRSIPTFLSLLKYQCLIHILCMPQAWHG